MTPTIIAYHGASMALNFDVVMSAGAELRNFMLSQEEYEAKKGMS